MSRTSCSFRPDKTIFVRLTLQRGLLHLPGIWPLSRMQLNPHAKSCSSESALTILVTKVSSMLIGPPPMGLCDVFRVKESATLLSIGLPIRPGALTPLPQTKLYTLTARILRSRQSNMEANYFRPALNSLFPLT